MGSMANNTQSVDVSVTAPDPRIALLQAQDRRLLLVGEGTLGMMLAAAEATGLIPPRTVTTEYGVLRSPADFVYPQRDAESALDQARLMGQREDGYTYTPVSSTRTRFPEPVTSWAPLSTEETNA